MTSCTVASTVVLLISMGAVSHAYECTYSGCTVGYHVKWCAFHLVGCYLNTLMLQLMAGAERLCHFLNGVASLCHIFKWGCEMKKVGNHCSSVYAFLKSWVQVEFNLSKLSQLLIFESRNRTVHSAWDSCCCAWLAARLPKKFVLSKLLSRTQ